MAAVLITNSVSTIGSLALLLNPPPDRHPAREVETPPPAEIAPAETLLGDWFGWRRKWSDHGFDFTVQYIGEAIGNVSGGQKQGAVYDGLVNLAGDLDLVKFAGWPGAQFHGAMLFPHGRSLTDKYVGDLFVLSNLDASDDVHLFELWLEQNFAEDTFSIRVGQMAVDQEFVFTEQGTLFANAAFGWFPIVGATAPVYPQGAPGIRIAWRPTEANYFQFAVTDGDVNPTDAGGRETNPHGVKFRFAEGAFIIAEAGHNWTLADDTKPGSLKLGSWYHTADSSHMRLDDTGLSLADPLSSGNPRTIGDNWGFYLAAEQSLWKETPEDKKSAQGAGVFGRVGYAPADRNTLGLYLEGGITSTGLLPGRDDDVCGVGIAYGRISRELRALTADANNFNGTADALPDHELVIEFDYQWNIRPGFQIQPGVQYIIHPGGSAAIDNALVIGLRTVLTF